MNKAAIRYISITGLVVTLIIVGYFIFRALQKPPDDSATTNPKEVQNVRTLQLETSINDMIYGTNRHLLYLPSRTGTKVYVINPKTGLVEGEAYIQYPTLEQEYPNKILMADNAKSFYVTASSRKVLKLSAETFQMESVATAGTQPSTMASQGDFLFVVNQEDNSVSVINKDNFTTVATIDVGEGPVDVCADPIQDFIYVSNHDNGTISVISSVSLSVVDILTGVGAPGEMLAYPASNVLLILDDKNNVLNVMDLATRQVIRRIPIVDSPDHMMIDQQNNYLYITSSADTVIGKVDLITEKLSEVIKLGSSFIKTEGENLIALDPNNGIMVIANTTESKLYFIDLR